MRTVDESDLDAKAEASGRQRTDFEVDRGRARLSSLELRSPQIKCIGCAHHTGKWRERERGKSGSSLAQGSGGSNRASFFDKLKGTGTSS